MISPGAAGDRRLRTRSRVLRPFWLGLVGVPLAIGVGLALVLGLVHGLPSASNIDGIVGGPGGRTEPQATTAPPTTRADVVRTNTLEDARALLERQVRAIINRNRDAYLSTIDPHPVSRDFARRAARTYDNLARMDVVEFGYDQLTEDPGALTPDRRRMLGETAYVVEAVMQFRLSGPDRRHEWRTSLRLVFVERDGRTYLAADHEGASPTASRPVWLEDEVAVARGERSLVIGVGEQERLRAYAEAADRAVPRVTEVWGRDWSRFVVVVVPRSQDQMEQAIDAEADSQDAVAAVTTSVGRGDPEHSSHIVLNPETFAEVGDLGRLVVLIHETTHVATLATVSDTPMWLSEGFADYVGFEETRLSTRTIAQELFAHVREVDVPRELPDKADFDPRTPGLDEAYESAWLACRYIAERWGEETLVRFYTRMNHAGSQHHAAVFRKVLGTTPEAFVADWRAYIQHLADQ